MPPFVDDGGKTTKVFMVTGAATVTWIDTDGVTSQTYFAAGLLCPADSESGASIVWQERMLEEIIERKLAIQDISFKPASVCVIYKDELCHLAKLAIARPKAKK